MLDAIRKRRRPQEQINYACIMLEGLFNTLGHDIIGATTIIPLFLSDLGASMGVIGGLSTMRQIISGVAPLLFGGAVAAAGSKRNLSIAVNGFGRGGILLIPLLLLLGFSGRMMIALFFGIIFLFHLCQPITGISWNYLLGNCVSPDRRGRLLGTLFGVSGAITLFSSLIIKAIRASRMEQLEQYTVIFALGGSLMLMSVLCYIPLREKPAEPVPRAERNPRAYLRALASCFCNRDYRWAIAANACSSMSTAISTFFFLFAQSALAMSPDAISNLLIAQTLGIMAGGLTSGRVSQRFGVKRMLLMAESAAALVPLFGLLSLHAGAFAFAAVFCIGFSRGGMIGYQAYILEVADPGRSIYFIVARSMALLPFSFVSIAVGAYLETHPMWHMFWLQLAVCLLALTCATRLRLTVYPRKNTDTNAREEAE